MVTSSASNEKGACDWRSSTWSCVSFISFTSFLPNILCLRSIGKISLTQFLLRTLALSILRLVKLGVLLYVDATFDYGSALLYSVLESNIGTVCVCLPVMGPLLGKIFPSLRMHTSNNGASKHTSKIYKNQSRIIRKDGENSSGFDEERELVSSSTNRGNIYEPTAKS